MRQLPPRGARMGEGRGLGLSSVPDAILTGLGQAPWKRSRPGVGLIWPLLRVPLSQVQAEALGWPRPPTVGTQLFLGQMLATKPPHGLEFCFVLFLTINFILAARDGYRGLILRGIDPSRMPMHSPWLPAWMGLGDHMQVCLTWAEAQGLNHAERAGTLYVNYSAAAAGEASRAWPSPGKAPIHLSGPAHQAQPALQARGPAGCEGLGLQASAAGVMAKAR